MSQNQTHLNHPHAKPSDSRNWLLRNRWLLARRSSQILIQLLFMIGPWFGVWWFKGNLSANLVLGTVPLADPFVVSQVLASGVWPSQNLLIGAALVMAFYLLVGGRVFCSWVCPVNLVTDLASWLRRRCKIRQSRSISRQTRHWLLLVLLLATAYSGILLWELVNPVSLLTRGLVFGVGSAWYFVVAVFLFDLLVSKNGWCGHLCPMGAAYSWIGKLSLVKVAVPGRQQCDDCMACYYVCPEPQVLKPALKGDSTENFMINSSECSHCGRCLDVCPQLVFEFSNKFVTHTDFKLKVEKTA